jgi:hypothetical protein
MTKEHRIHTVLDMLSLSADEFQRMVPDLCAWYAFTKLAEAVGAEGTGFVWIDDGRTAEIHSVVATAKETGEVSVFKGSAHPEVGC